MMRTRYFTAGWALICCPSLAFGQSWSEEQLEIVDAMRSCNDGWVESVRADDYELFEAACPQSPGAVFWYTNAPEPVAFGGDDGHWVRTVAQVRDIAWTDLEPLEVTLDGDVAVIYYEVTWLPELRSGEKRESRSRRLSVFHRQDGLWRTAGGTAAPAPTEPPKPPVLLE